MTSSTPPLQSSTASYLSIDAQDEAGKTSTRRSTRPSVLVGTAHEMLPIGASTTPLDVKGRLSQLLRGLGPKAAWTDVAALLEARVRQGQHEQRALLHALLPLAAFELGADLLDNQNDRLLPNIGNAPDLYTFILQAALPAAPHEDRIVAFMRSSVFFFLPSRRMQKRAEWDTAHAKTLVLVLRACLPSLLSLFPGIATKDVAFELRVVLYRRWHALIAGSHDQRLEFFSRHRSLIQACFALFLALFLLCCVDL